MAELSLTEIFAWLRKRDTSALPETTRAMILEAWHTGRLPLVADRVREFRCACPVRPHVWVPEPAPDDEKAKRYVEELRQTQIVGYLPATAAQTTDELEKVLFNQMVVPAEIIPRRDIKFHWTAGTAVWRDRATGFVAEFSGIRTTREACNRAWPPPPVQAPKQWVVDEIKRLVAANVIQKGIGRHALAHELKPRLDDAYGLGLVTHTMTEDSIYNEIGQRHWAVWPLTWLPE